MAMPYSRLLSRTRAVSGRARVNLKIDVSGPIRRDLLEAGQQSGTDGIRISAEPVLSRNTDREVSADLFVSRYERKRIPIMAEHSYAHETGTP